MDFIEASKTQPEYIIYDDACHLAKMVKNKASNNFNNSTARGGILASKNIVCDRFHFKTHNDNWCKDNCDPDRFPGLKEVNTSVTEQTNFWFGGYKHALKHMGYERYHFMLYILSDEFNKFKLINLRYEYEIKKKSQV